MLKAVFLDLDNTMVLFDEQAYIDAYFSAIAPWFSDLYPPGEFRRRYLDAAFSLRENDGSRTNRVHFLERFCDGGAVEAERVWRRFESFYEGGHSRIRVDVSVPPGLHDTVDALREMGLALVVASNPIFPRSAQITRMGWAGLSADDFTLFTHMENMCFVKPQVAYYRQICEHAGLEPGACLMAGNDPANDMVAKQAGLNTYLVRENGHAHLVSLSLGDGERNRFDGSPPDFSGPFSGILPVARKLSALL